MYFVLAYFFGSIPFGLIFSKLFFRADIREIGSGNIGATNAFRLGGKWLGGLTFISDLLKGFVAVYLMPENLMYPGLILVVIGHIFPIWLGFRGGKGIATSFGGFFWISPFFALNLILIWILIYERTRISGLASITVSIIAPLLSILYGLEFISIFLVSGLLLFAHVKNIISLLRKLNSTI